MADAPTQAAAPVSRTPEVLDEQRLVDVLDRVIARGVVVTGDVVVSVAGVDLVHLGLQLVLHGIDD